MYARQDKTVESKQMLCNRCFVGQQKQNFFYVPSVDAEQVCCNDHCVGVKETVAE